MPETAKRQTFDEYLSEWFDDDIVEVFKDEVAALGYVIVHPDDVPVRDDPDPHREDWEDGWEVGWNACRAHIFGDDTQ